MAKLEAKNISFRYEEDEELIIKDFSIKFPDTGFVGILGPNGCGKSTLMALLAGSLNPSKGSVQLYNKSTSEYDSEEAVNEKVTFIFQNMEFESEETVAELIEIISSTNPNENKEYTTQLIKDFKIENLLERSIQDISKGQLQKVIMLFALLFGPDIILLDEPVFALSYDDAQEMLTLFKREATKRNLLVLISLHNLSQMEEFCNKVLLFDKKQSFKFDEAEILLAHDVLEEAYGTPYNLLKQPESVASAVEKLEEKHQKINKKK